MAAIIGAIVEAISRRRWVVEQDGLQIPVIGIGLDAPALTGAQGIFDRLRERRQEDRPDPLLGGSAERLAASFALLAADIVRHRRSNLAEQRRGPIDGEIDVL